MIINEVSSSDYRLILHWFAKISLCAIDWFSWFLTSVPNFISYRHIRVHNRAIL